MSAYGKTGFPMTIDNNYNVSCLVMCIYQIHVSNFSTRSFFPYCLIKRIFGSFFFQDIQTNKNEKMVYFKT